MVRDDDAYLVSEDIYENLAHCFTLFITTVMMHHVWGVGRSNYLPLLVV
jgi:hypothetical protein